MMNQGKYVFAQIVEFLPQRVFDHMVDKYSGNKYVKHFTCWNQLLCMVFGQLTNRDSLRDLMVALDATVRLHRITLHSAYFVIRGKTTLKFNRMYSRKIDKTNGVRFDQIGRLTGFYVSKDYPEKLRRVKYFDEETERTFVFLTNNFDLTAEQVALLYKNRWQIELFFKWIKQHLKIKSFWGTTTSFGNIFYRQNACN